MKSGDDNRHGTAPQFARCTGFGAEELLRDGSKAAAGDGATAWLRADAPSARPGSHLP
jgi:hypothetical protein